MSIADWQRLQAIPQFSITPWHWDIALKKEVFQYAIFVILIYFNPSMIQRFYMASSVRQAVKIFNAIWISWVALAIIFLSIAVVLHLGNHPIQSNQNVLQYILDQAYFPGMQAMLITTSIALLMSSADSELHIASVLFTNDLWPMITHVVKSRISPMTVTRMAAIVVGIISLMVALYTSANSVEQLLITAACLYAPIHILLLFTGWGFRPHAITALGTIAIHACITIYLIFQGSLLSKHFFVLICSSIVTLLLTHYFLPRFPNTGWIGIKDRSDWDRQNQAIQRWWRERLQQLQAPFTPVYRKNLFPKEVSTFILFGIYVIISTIIAIFFIQKVYFFPYVYGYMAIMAIGTIVVLYPALHGYRPGGHPILHWIWLIVLFLVLFVFNIQMAKLGHFSPMVCALWVANLALAVVLLSLDLSIMMLGIAIILHKAIPPFIPGGVNLLWSGCTLFSLELVLAAMLTTAAVVGFGVYRHLRNKSVAKLKVMELTRAYEHRISLEAIYNQANWSRLDAVHNSNLLCTIGKKLHETLLHAFTNSQAKVKEETDFLIKKIDKLSNLLLFSAREERSIKLNKKAIQYAAIEQNILTANQHILALGEPVALLLHNETAVRDILVDPELFECFLTLNLWEVSKSKQNRDHVVTLTIADTLLQYDYAENVSIEQSPLTLPALVFVFSTDMIRQKLASLYIIAQTTTPLPTSQEQFYQIESRQMVEAHGGYTAIIENEVSLTCLYVLPINGQQVMQFKNYDSADLVSNKLAETAESIAQEKALVTGLTKATTLTEETIVQTIDFIKKAHGLVLRQSGAPYYTHPMAVAEILLTVTQDPVTILAGLLHDVIEDTPVTLHQIEVRYGEAVATIVAQVTHYNTNGYRWKLEDSEVKDRLAQCNDIRVVQVKLADRLHNVRTLYARKPRDQRRVAQETLTFYIPWGERSKGPKPWLEEMKQICNEILKSPE